MYDASTGVVVLLVLCTKAPDTLTHKQRLDQLQELRFAVIADHAILGII